MKYLIVTVCAGAVALAIGLMIGNLGETSQILIIAGAIVGIVYGSAALIFVAALYSTFKLWQIVLDALHGGKSSHQAKALLQLIGGFDLQGGNVRADRKQTVKVTGTGLLGTLFIVGFACVAIYIMFSIVPRDADIVKVGGKPVLSKPTTPK